MVKNSFVFSVTYVVDTHWQFQCVPTTYVTENKEAKYLEIYIFQVSCPLSLHLLNIPNSRSVLKLLSLYCKIQVHELSFCQPGSCMVVTKYWKLNETIER